MNIGKLKKCLFVDILRNDEEYTYFYLLYSKKFFKTLFFKMTFKSKLPFYTFTDIRKVMRHKGFYFEDLINKITDLSIGNIVVEEFTLEDEKLYSTDHYYWNINFFDDALDKQQIFKEEYNDEFGHPDDIGLFEAYKNIK
jgi:hypothetical protein